ncbi:hypothetical protein AYI70_g8317 [Smittium culicis]|uniref:Reverse transcriptase domain-containing protein n=1 Tax=Smittium culicis TaxID=133412 RepID=A0A1R1XGK3_9FUNG|nr:hypothetical protein AYI70_g8317 [Smittium culicis]
MMSSETVTSEAKDETTSKDDQHISVCSPETVLNVYSELESLIPSIPGNSYRAMLTDEEKKKAIYGCPKSKKVSHNPSLIKEAAHGSVKKADAAFYAIQDASFESKPDIRRSEELEVKTLLDSEKFETQLAVIKSTKRARVMRSLLGRQQTEGLPILVRSITATAPITEAAATRPAPNSSRGGFQKGAKSRGRGRLLERFDEESVESPKRYSDGAATTNIASSAIQAEAQPRGPPDPGGGGGIPTNKESNRGGDESKPRILQKFILHSKEDWGATHSIESKEAEPVPRGKVLQDGISSIILKYLRFCWNRRSYQFLVLPFVLNWAQIQKIGVSAYLDDVIIVEESKEVCMRHTGLKNSNLTELGYLINTVKSELIPSQRIIHLGMTIDSREMSLKVPTSKIRDLQREKGTSDLIGAPTGAINSGTTARAEVPILHSGTPMGAFPEDECQASSNVYRVSSKLGASTEPLNCNYRMVTFEQGILPIGKELVSGPPIYRPERAAVQLGRLEKPLLLPAMEPDCTDSPEDETRADNNDYNYTRMDVGDLVSGHVSTIDFTATNSTSNRGGPQLEKRKVPANQGQILGSNGMENQRSALKDKGVSNTAIILIFNSQRPSMDISPVIEYFREISDNEQLNIKSLAIKTCCLLEVCGYMRASDIHRIDGAQTTTIDGTLKLVTVALKEKRKGCPIIRPCEIS